MKKTIKEKKEEKVVGNDMIPRTIFEEAKANKAKARQVLLNAKKIENEKLKEGWHYVMSADGKTFTLTKP